MLLNKILGVFDDSLVVLEWSKKISLKKSMQDIFWVAYQDDLSSMTAQNESVSPIQTNTNLFKERRLYPQVF